MDKARQRYRVGCIIGTRPEVIKMAPIVFLLKKSSWAEVFLINTAQHRGLLDDMLSIFGLSPDEDLNIMRINQSLGSLTGNLCFRLDAALKKESLHALLAVGDTTTVFVSSLIAFYRQIPFAHIEAGMRTHDRKQPFPEEINRTLTAPLSNWHFVPTETEKQNLLRENINESTIHVTGNPVIDSMYWILKHKMGNERLNELQNMIIVTAHRRENFGKNLNNICQALIELTCRFKDINFVLPVHPNPHVQKEVLKTLGQQNRIHLIDPLKYDEFVHLMNRSIFVMTDSGGIQEEAPALKKPVLILRNITERPAIIKEGVGILVGTEKDDIVKAATQLLTNERLYLKMSRGVSPYGDGYAAQRIVTCLQKDIVRPC